MSILWNSVADDKLRFLPASQIQLHMYFYSSVRISVGRKARKVFCRNEEHFVDSLVAA